MTPVSFLSTLLTGLTDCAGPATITSVIIFAFVLFFIIKCRGQQALFVIGGGFVVGMVVTTPLANLGLYDNWLNSEWFDILTQWVHFFIEAFCLVVGCISLRDWRIYKATQDTTRLLIRYPFLEEDLAVKRRWRLLWVWWILVAYLSGTVTAMFVSVWPGNQSYFSVLQYRIFMQGLRGQTLFLALCYGLIFSSPLILELHCFKMAMDPAIKKKLTMALPKVQVVVAAVMLAYGATMLYLYYVRFYLINQL